MELNAIMTHDIETIEPDATLRDAAQMMKHHNIGILPVFDGVRVVGVITDRDITVRATAAGKNPLKTKVSEIMTAEVVCCPAGFDVTEAVSLMKTKKIRRILVVDSDHHPVGIISLGDLAAHVQDETLIEDALEEITRSYVKKKNV